MMKLYLILIIAVLGSSASAEQCGRQNGGARCPDNLCCSQYGWCGTTRPYCGGGCQSQCSSSGGGGGSSGSGGNNNIRGLISGTLFYQFLKHRNDGSCPAHGFYSYHAFVTAAESFPGFCSTGDQTTRKRELAAFFGQTSHETTGGWPSAPDGPYAWGYCYVREVKQDVYCSSGQYPCASGQKYYGRGPIQLTHNYNYGQAGQALGLDLINNPDLVATDAIASFKTAIWFWMTPQWNKPSCHAVITGQWTPSGGDWSARRALGYGVITNIINGKQECGHGRDDSVADRIGFYKRYCDMLGVSYGSNLDCFGQGSF